TPSQTHSQNSSATSSCHSVTRILDEAIGSCLFCLGALVDVSLSSSDEFVGGSGDEVDGSLTNASRSEFSTSAADSVSSPADPVTSLSCVTVSCSSGAAVSDS